MIEETAKFASSLMTDFTLRKFIGSLIVIVLLLLIFIGYDRYTANSRLNKIERVSAMVIQLDEIQKSTRITSDDELVKILNWLETELAIITSTQSRQSITSNSGWLGNAFKIAMGGTGWYWLAIAVLLSGRTKSKKFPGTGEWAGFVLVMFFAFGTSIFLYSVLPESSSWLWHTFLSFIPVFIFFALIFLLALMSKKRKIETVPTSPPGH